jgi:hypothetical protein
MESKQQEFIYDAFPKIVKSRLAQIHYITRIIPKTWDSIVGIATGYNTGFCLSSSCFVVSVKFEVFTAVTTKNGVFWDVTPCAFCENRRFGGT